MNHAHTAIAVSALALATVSLGATNAAATHPGENGVLPGPAVPYDWPNEGTGYPGYADQPSPSSTEPNQGLDTTSVALGTLAGLALSGVGLGIGRTVQGRRDHATLPTP
ncbi:hypothetical protein [Kribbella sp. NPDC003557]|uniref:hypothetical protein n=1 Tax=Kribbella sp. NPDC003557 TaxID=3154449 RepID=UPI0033A55CB2